MTREGMAAELGRNGMSPEARNALVLELDQLFGPLDHREAALVEERMFADSPKTLEELGGDLGVTRERVRQLEKDILERLKARTVPAVSPLRGSWPLHSAQRRGTNVEEQRLSAERNSERAPDALHRHREPRRHRIAL